jgi:hypothetical protein
MRHQFIAAVVFVILFTPGPHVPLLRGQAVPGAGSARLHINEIQFAPAAGLPEWLELVNTGPEAVDLSGWVLHDAGTARPVITDSTFWLQPGSFLVICGDERLTELLPASVSVLVMQRFPSLNNTGDDISLVNPSGYEEESVAYRADWGGGGGVSLERLDATREAQDKRNWLPCSHPSGGTPGRRNSVATPSGGFLSAGAAPALTCVPNPFSPDQDGHEDHCTISWRLTLETAQVRLRVFDAAGRPVRTIVANAASGREGSVEWDGCDTSGTPVAIGIYPVLIEGADAAGAVCAAKTVVVVAGRL